jgi:glutamate dehydrogenase (NADP+)
VLTGKSPKWGGSLIRPEATGYGAVYFAQEMLKHKGDDLKGKRCVVSGAGNVAQYATEKILDLGGIPITMSDSAGYIVEPEGFTREQLAALMHLKNVKRGRVSEYLETSSTAKYHAGKRPWAEPCDCAFPSATQNEIDVADAEALVAGGCKLVSEGANMPSTPGAIGVYFEKGIFYGPGKAANAGGVAVSGLEMAQDSSRIQWSREEVDAKLHSIMKEIFRQCVEAAEKVGKPDNLQVGANVAGFLKVADSMIEQGCV